jgi:hypothetical protein
MYKGERENEFFNAFTIWELLLSTVPPKERRKEQLGYISPQ